RESWVTSATRPQELFERGRWRVPETHRGEMREAGAIERLEVDTLRQSGGQQHRLVFGSPLRASTPDQPCDRRRLCLRNHATNPRASAIVELFRVIQEDH